MYMSYIYIYIYVHPSMSGLLVTCAYFAQMTFEQAD